MICQKERTKERIRNVKNERKVPFLIMFFFVAYRIRISPSGINRYEILDFMYRTRMRIPVSGYDPALLPSEESSNEPPRKTHFLYLS